MMAASVELQYPLPTDTIATDFHAGGTYDASSALNPKRNDAAAGPVALTSPLPANSYIRCELVAADGTSLGVGVEDLTDQDDVGTWDVQITANTTGVDPGAWWSPRP
jgi:hypothetical protein